MKPINLQQFYNAAMTQPYPTDIIKLLTFSRNLFANYLTLQQMIQTDDIQEDSFDRLHPCNQKLAEEKFSLLLLAAESPEAFSRAIRDFLSSNPDIRKQ